MTTYFPFSLLVFIFIFPFLFFELVNMTKNATKEGQLKPGHSKKAACLSVSSKKKFKNQTFVAQKFKI